MEPRARIRREQADDQRRAASPPSGAAAPPPSRRRAPPSSSDRSGATGTAGSCRARSPGNDCEVLQLDGPGTSLISASRRADRLRPPAHAGAGPGRQPVRHDVERNATTRSCASRPAEPPGNALSIECDVRLGTALERRIPARTRPTPVVREAVRRLLAHADETAPRLGHEPAALPADVCAARRRRSSCWPRATTRSRRSQRRGTGRHVRRLDDRDHGSRRRGRGAHRRRVRLRRADAPARLRPLGRRRGQRVRARLPVRGLRRGRLAATASGSTTGSKSCSSGPTRRWPSSPRCRSSRRRTRCRSR